MVASKTTGLMTPWWLALLCGAVGAIEYMDCDSKYNLQTVVMSGCSTAPCQIKLNTTVNVTTQFIPVSDASMLSNNVYFSLNNARIVASVRPDPCSSFVCPLSTKLQTAYTYSSEVFVPDSLPALSGELAWSLQDEKSVTVICFRVDIQLLPNKASIASVSAESPPHPADGNQSHPADVSSNNPSGGQYDPSGGHYNPSAGHYYPPGETSGGHYNPSAGQYYPPGGPSGGHYDPHNPPRQQYNLHGTT
ncbi:uncharacterized protein LOC134530619 [Bacillus rossius redtenbacheri]|uniref:uncharacterized protein LOC134530619 n=1 Tax=Bacillus rossius redtenbacheri TaxID=93214 RepID=UPI002FDDF4E9